MLLSICCSSQASAIADRLSERLRRTLNVDTLLIAEDSAPVSETWEEGAAADAVLILLDRLSAPPPLRLDDWSGLTHHGNQPPIAFVRLEECAYPKLLERRRFLPLSNIDRTVEQWAVSLLPPGPGITPAPIEAAIPDEWWGQLVDQSGSAETTDPGAAQAFCRQAQSYFQNIVWIGCAGREPALIGAEMEHRKGAGRALIVLAHLEKPVPLPQGRHSYLTIRNAPPQLDTVSPLGACYAPIFPGWFALGLGAGLQDAIPLDESTGLYRLSASPATTPELRQLHLNLVNDTLQHWKKRPELCRTLLYEVPAALRHGFAHDWPKAIELARRAAFLLLAEGRRREGIRLFNQLLLQAEEHGDSEAAADALHELSWLTGDDSPAAPESLSGQQLSFDLT
ncbi:MAG: hypothetical protein HYX27_11375 [Acidobacteria bacterium]|nr:hypothetical protein [Acidobacteriota bacterium]